MAIKREGHEAWSGQLRNHGLPVGALGGQRGPSPMLGVRRDASPSYRAASPRSASMQSAGVAGANNSYTKLLAITKDHESMCSHLLSTARTLDEQIRTLRAEHEALRVEAQAMRRCLDRAGVLPTSDLEKEIQHCTPITPPPPANAICSDSSPVAATVAPPEGSVALGVPHGEAAMPPAEASYPSTSAAGEAVGLHSSSASTPSLAAQASTPPNRGEESAEDLFDLAAPLLDRQSSMADQQRSLRAVQRHLKDLTEPPNTWRGPGTPLYSAVKASRVDLARLLLRAKANANEKDAKGVSALHLATFDGNTEICRALLLGRADVDSCDRHGQTSLFFAPTRDVCKILVEKRADVTVLNRKGQSALHLAGRAGLSEVLAWLSTRVNRQLLELKDIHGATARYYAAQTGACPPLPEESPSSKRAGMSRGGMSSSSAGAAALVAAQNHYMGTDQSHSSESHVQDLPSPMPGIEIGQLPSVSEIIEDGRSSQEQSPDIDAAGGVPQESVRRNSLPSVSTIVEAATSPNEDVAKAEGAAAIEEEPTSVASDAKKDSTPPARSKASSSATVAYPVKSWSKPAQVVVPASTRRKPEMPKAALNRQADRSTTPNKIQTQTPRDRSTSGESLTPSSSRDAPTKRMQSSTAPSPTNSRGRTPANAASPVRHRAQTTPAAPAAQPSAVPAHQAEASAALATADATEVPAPEPAPDSVASTDSSASATPVADTAPAPDPVPAPPEELQETRACEETAEKKMQDAPSEIQAAAEAIVRQPDPPPASILEETKTLKTIEEPKTVQTTSPKVEEFSICDQDPTESSSDPNTAARSHHKNSLEVMFEDGFGQAHSLSSSEQVEAPARTEADSKLRDAGVIECDDTGAFDSLTQRQQEATGASSSKTQSVDLEPKSSEKPAISAEEAAALAEAGVFDGGDLAEAGVFDDDVGTEIFDLKDNAEVGSHSHDAAPSAASMDQTDQEDLAAIGVLTEDDMSMLRAPSLQDADGADMAALADEGVIDVGEGEDVDDLADAGVFEGDDADLEAAGIFLGTFEISSSPTFRGVMFVRVTLETHSTALEGQTETPFYSPGGK